MNRMSGGLIRVTYTEVYDAVLTYMRRRQFQDIDRLADGIANTMARCLSEGLDTASTVKELMRLRSRSFSLNRVSKAEFLSDIERHLRTEMERVPLVSTATSLREIILQAVDVDDSQSEVTQLFRGKKHDTLLRDFINWLSGRLHDLGLKIHSGVSQGPSDQGVDAIVEVTNGLSGRVGIQLENDRTIRRQDFKEQMAKVYGYYDITRVDLLIVVFCGDETDKSVRLKVRHQIAIVGQKKDPNIIAIEPTKAITILGGYLAP